MREFMEVQAHGNTKLHVIHTNDLHKAATTIEQFERYLQFERHKIVGVDVKYTNDHGEDQKPALAQLSIGKDHPVLLSQLSAADKNCTMFDNFLADPRYMFVGFSIDGDIEMLGRIGLEIAHYVDIQKECKVPTATKPLDSLGDVSGILVHDVELTNTEHQRWACMHLSMRHNEYAAKDAYAAYEIWSCLSIIQEGLRREKLDKEQTRKRTRSCGDYDY
ncbi:hypothetical protein CFC21_085083 [Triticum aestivum]|uniref:3'-5' exonuclease domain-containing protein n=2 Tax=Triticum aestivum TaxID=4565 RepID=A0A9R1L811_WHEAT|nr:hypothetical protein CFC21_085083 [Triticum aestivum]